MCKSYRSRQELSHEHLLAKIGVDTAENAPSKSSRGSSARLTELKFSQAGVGLEESKIHGNSSTMEATVRGDKRKVGAALVAGHDFLSRLERCCDLRGL